VNSTSWVPAGEPTDVFSVSSDVADNGDATSWRLQRKRRSYLPRQDLDSRRDPPLVSSHYR
jgi:hypothetical protein